MTTARQIIANTLGFRLNRLSPGETLDADLAATCLAALNDIGDSWNGTRTFLFREIFVSGVVNGVSGTLGTNWTGVASGDQILGATVSYQSGMDIPIDAMSMAQYADIAQKATASIPQGYAHDGAATVYFWPAAAGQTVTLRVKQSLSAFPDLDTNFALPSGYQSALRDCLAELLAPTLNPGALNVCMVAARAARSRIAAQTCSPAVVDGVDRRTGNILTGWN